MPERCYVRSLPKVVDEKQFERGKPLAAELTLRIGDYRRECAGECRSASRVFRTVG